MSILRRFGLAAFLALLLLRPALAVPVAVNGRVIEIPVPAGFCTVDATTTGTLFIDIRLPRSPVVFSVLADCEDLAALQRDVPVAVMRMMIVAVPCEYFDGLADRRGFEWTQAFAAQVAEADDIVALVRPNLVVRRLAAEGMEMRGATIMGGARRGSNGEVIARVHYDYRLGGYAARQDVHAAATVLRGVPLLVSSIWAGSPTGEEARAEAFSTYLDDLARANPGASVRQRLVLGVLALVAVLSGGLAFVLRDGPSA